MSVKLSEHFKKGTKEQQALASFYFES